MSQTPEHYIGIDFGTSKCVTTRYNPLSRRALIVRNGEREERTPSAVLYHDDGRVLVGRAALKECEDDPAQQPNLVLSCKRLVADDDYQYDVTGDPTARRVATDIFRKLHADLAQEFGFLPTRAVVTVPAIFTPVQRLAIREAAQAGGFDEVELLEEPVAAAITYSEEGADPGERFLIYDLGAGTFDLALLRRVPEKPSGRNGEKKAAAYEQALPAIGLRFGGDDIDEAVFRLLDRKCRAAYGTPLAGDGREKTHLLYRCRLQKELLAAGRVTPFSYISPSAKTRMEFTISLDEFSALVEEQLYRTVEPVRQMIATARRKLHLPDAGEAFPLDDLVLVGGSTALQQIPRLLTTELKARPREFGQRDVAVAVGAAYQAWRLWRPAAGDSAFLHLGAAQQSVTAPATPPASPWADAGRAGGASDLLITAPVPSSPPLPPLPPTEPPPPPAPAGGAGGVPGPSNLFVPPTLKFDGGAAVGDEQVTQVLSGNAAPPPPAETTRIASADLPAVPAPPPTAPAAGRSPVPTTPGAPPVIAARVAVVVTALPPDAAAYSHDLPARVAVFLRSEGDDNGGAGEPVRIGQGFLQQREQRPALETTYNVVPGRVTLYAQLDDGSPAQEFGLDCPLAAVYTLSLRLDPRTRRFTSLIETSPAG